MRVATAIGLVLALLVGIGLTGCVESNSTVNGTVVSVTENSATRLETGKGLDVYIPAGAASGSGTLSVRATSMDGLDGWKISIAGAKLRGNATLTFRGSAGKGEPAPIVLYSESGGPLTAAHDVSLTSRSATVVTNHFSFWSITWWSSIRAKLASAWRNIFGPAKGGTPSCASPSPGAAASYSVTASSDDRIEWCTETGSLNRPRIKVVNPRSYPVAVFETSHMVLTNPDDSLASLLSQLLASLDTIDVPRGNTMHLLQAGASYTYQDASDSVEQLQFHASGIAYIGSALMFGVDTVQLLLQVFGKSRALRAIVQSFGSASCVSNFHSTATSTIDSLGEAQEYMTNALGAVDKCLGPVIEEQFGADGVAASIAIGGLTWLLTGVNELGVAKSAIVDSIKYPANFVITVHPPGLSAAELNSIEAPAMCMRPPGSLVDGSLPVSDPMVNGATGLAPSYGGSGPPLTAAGVPASVGHEVFAVVFLCNAGGVNWPEVIGIYDANVRLMGSIDLGAIDQQEHSDVVDLSMTSAGLHVDWYTNDATCHTGADTSIPRSADFVIETSGVAMATNLKTGVSNQPCMGG